MTTTAVIRKVLERDKWMCVIQSSLCIGEASCADHRANRGSGGSTVLDNPANLIAACTLCNYLKEDANRSFRAYLIKRGVRVEKDKTNEATLSRCLLTPVTYPDGSEWWLTRDGRRVSDVPEF